MCGGLTGAAAGRAGLRSQAGRGGRVARMELSWLLEEQLRKVMRGKWRRGPRIPDPPAAAPPSGYGSALAVAGPGADHAVLAAVHVAIANRGVLGFAEPPRG